MAFVHRFILVLMVAGSLPVALRANEPGNNSNRHKDVKSIFGGTPLFWRADWVMDYYATQITRYYNLNKEQEDYTRKLLSQRVKSFLQDHEREARGLMAEYMEYQLSQELPDAKTAKEFANRAGPLAHSIRKEILEGNMKWREILDDQQKAKHDQDLRQMTMFFDNLELGLERWKQGRVQPTDVPGRVGPSPITLGAKVEDTWEYWVKQFIQLYKLDDGQQQTAFSILRELKDEAARYRETNKDKFSDLETATKAITQRESKTDPEELAKYQQETAQVNKRREELNAPLNAMFTQLRSRVEAIPTVDQRKNRQAEIDRMKMMSRFVAGSRPAFARSATTQTAPAVDSKAAVK